MDQIEDGYTRIAHTLLEKLAKAHMPANALRMTIWAIRNTYGYHRKYTKPTSIRQISKDIDMPIGSTFDAIQYLSQIEVLEKTETGGYFFNKRNVGVRPTEQPPLFGPPNKSVRPTERNVRPTEHSECNILKDTRKIEKDRKFSLKKWGEDGKKRIQELERNWFCSVAPNGVCKYCGKRIGLDNCSCARFQQTLKEFNAKINKLAIAGGLK